MKEMKTYFLNALQKGPIGIYLIALCIPLYSKYLPFAIVITVVEFLLRKEKIHTKTFKKQLTWKNPGLWLFLFYFLHLIGLVHTENMRFANMDLGMKVTLALFPILFLFFHPKINWKAFVYSFVAGALLSIAINWGISFSMYLETGSIKPFYDSRLTHLMHRGYWAIYLSIAVLFLLKFAFEAVNKKSFYIHLLLALFIAFFAVLSISKMGLIVLAIISVWAIVKMMLRFNNKWVLPLSIFFLVGSGLAVYTFVPAMKPRITNTFQEMNKPIEEYDQDRPGSTGARILVWETSIELIKENFWFGVGTGDIKDELIKRNEEKGYRHIAEKEINSHNQFLNSHLALGVLAPLFLLMAIISGMIKRNIDPFVDYRRWVFFILFMAMLTESMLEVEAGIIPYAFLLSFLPIASEKSV